MAHNITIENKFEIYNKLDPSKIELERIYLDHHLYNTKLRNLQDGIFSEFEKYRKELMKSFEEYKQEMAKGFEALVSALKRETAVLKRPRGKDHNGEKPILDNFYKTIRAFEIQKTEFERDDSNDRYATRRALSKELVQLVNEFEYVIFEGECCDVCDGQIFRFARDKGTKLNSVIYLNFRDDNNIDTYRKRLDQKEIEGPLNVFISAYNTSCNNYDLDATMETFYQMAEQLGVVER
jgi:hypothetical protein